MKRGYLLSCTIAVAVGLGCPPPASAADVDCAAFAKQVDDGLKKIAILSTERGQEHDVAIELKLIELNLSLAMKHNCPLPRTPIRLDTYRKAAYTCKRVWTPETHDTGPCDQSSWKPE